LIIDSVGDGKRIAVGIDEYLRGVKHPDPEIEVEVLEHHRMFPDFMEIPRQHVPVLPLERRTGVTEVETGYDEQAAVREARRCLRCWVNTVFEGNEYDGSRCILCGGCVDVCPQNCLSLVPLEQIEFPAATGEHLQNNIELFGVELADVAADELGVITGSAMLKDETQCIRCGLCAERCPVAVITMEAYRWKTADAASIIPAQSMDWSSSVSASGR
jgi:ferredoxin